LNAAAFLNEIRDPQVQIVLPGAVGTAFANAGAARSKGLEINGEAVPLRDLTVNFGVSVLDARYTDYKNASLFYPRLTAPYGLGGAVVGNADGNRLVNSPDTAYNVGFRYALPISLGGKLTVGMNYAFTSRIYWSPDNLFSQKSYGLLDANLGYVFRDSRYSLKIWGTNLSGEKYYVSGDEVSSTAVGQTGTPGAPRTVGITLSFRE
jgi:iron complex outermembrane receptor protein